MSGWENFLLAEVGASAALVGLIFVSVSINLNRILSLPKLPNRALEALLILLAVLVVSSLLLVPGQSIRFYGIEVVIVGLVVWMTTISLDLRIWRNTEASYRRLFWSMAAMNQLTILPYILAGTYMMIDGHNGLYWLVLAFILSFIKALIDSWVLLIEINR